MTPLNLNPLSWLNLRSHSFAPNFRVTCAINFWLIDCHSACRRLVLHVYPLITHFASLSLIMVNTARHCWTFILKFPRPECWAKPSTDPLLLITHTFKDSSSTSKTSHCCFPPLSIMLRRYRLIVCGRLKSLGGNSAMSKTTATSGVSPSSIRQLTSVGVGARGKSHTAD